LWERAPLPLETLTALMRRHRERAFGPRDPDLLGLR
jgi:hypothetical protein